MAEATQLKEVRELAQAASRRADSAFNAIDTHEKICAERYTHIKEAIAALGNALTTNSNNTATAMGTMQTSINNLSSTKSAAMGAMGVIKYASVVLALVAIITAVSLGVKAFIISPQQIKESYAKPLA